jgi:excinuclease UvrABC nuclease subunit
MYKETGMTLTLKGTGYEAEGPLSTNDLKEQSGVYIITGKNNPGDSHAILDVGEAGNIKERVSNHDRSDSWNKQFMYL